MVANDPYGFSSGPFDKESKMRAPRLISGPGGESQPRYPFRDETGLANDFSLQPIPQSKPTSGPPAKNSEFKRGWAAATEQMLDSPGVASKPTPFAPGAVSPGAVAAKTLSAIIYGHRAQANADLKAKQDEQKRQLDAIRVATAAARASRPTSSGSSTTETITPGQLKYYEQVTGMDLSKYYDAETSTIPKSVVASAVRIAGQKIGQSRFQQGLAAITAYRGETGTRADKRMSMTAAGAQLKKLNDEANAIVDRQMPYFGDQFDRWFDEMLNGSNEGFTTVTRDGKKLRISNVENKAYIASQLGILRGGKDGKGNPTYILVPEGENVYQAKERLKKAYLERMRKGRYLAIVKTQAERKGYLDMLNNETGLYNKQYGEYGENITGDEFGSGESDEADYNAQAVEPGNQTAQGGQQGAAGGQQASPGVTRQQEVDLLNQRMRALEALIQSLSEEE